MEIRRFWSGAFRWLTVPAALLIVGAVCWLLHGHPRFITPLLSLPNIPNDVEIHLSKVHLHGISGGKVVWEMVADDFDLSKFRPTLHIQGLKQVAMLQDGKQALNVSADTVEKNIQTGDFTLDGHVCVTGAKLEMQTATVIWQASRGWLSFPMPSTAQLGDMALTVSGNTTFDTQTNHLLCQGPVIMTTRGNSLTAGDADVDLTHHNLALMNKVTGDFAVADVQDWMEGRNLPSVPPIPSAVQQRYREYCQQQGIPLPASLAGAVPQENGGRP